MNLKKILIASVVLFVLSTLVSFLATLILNADFNVQGWRYWVYYYVPDSTVTLLFFIILAKTEAVWPYIQAFLVFFLSGLIALLVVSMVVGKVSYPSFHSYLLPIILLIVGPAIGRALSKK